MKHDTHWYYPDEPLLNANGPKKELRSTACRLIVHKDFIDFHKPSCAECMAAKVRFDSLKVE